MTVLKTPFDNLKIGEHFEGWGDELGATSFLSWIRAVKVGPETFRIVSINEDCDQGGVQVLIDPCAEVVRV